jgi:hypothetical protein
MTPDAMIDKYVQLRDRKSELKKKMEGELAKYTEAMTTLENWLLDHLNANKTESMRTAHGTAYKYNRTSCRVTDWSQTLEFIRHNEAWELLEARVSKTGAVAIIEDTKLPIPGVDVTTEIVVNVRRAAPGIE